MANNYLQFSECVADLTPPEAEWWRRATEDIAVYDGREWDESEDRPTSEPEYVGMRGLREAAGTLDGDYYEQDFQYLICPAEDHLTQYLWLYADEYGNVEQIAVLMQQFLKQFRPSDYWLLTFAATCSKPRVGEFSGGGVFVTAEIIRWDNAEAFIEREKASFVERRIGKPEEFTDAGPTIVVSVSGGVVQDVFCSAPDSNVLLVDWDGQENEPSAPGVVNLDLDGRSHSALVSESQAEPLGKLLSTDVEKAIQAAVQQGILEQPLSPT